MKQQKKPNPSSHLCEALLRSPEEGMVVIEEMIEAKTLTAEVVESLAVRIHCDERWIKRSVSALHIATLKGMIDVLTKLLAIEGLNPNVKDEDGWTPLYIAARFCGTSSSMDCVRALVGTKNIDINTQNNNRESSLMDAVYFCEHTSSMECVQYLLSRPQIDFNLQNEYGESAFAYALENSSTNKMLVIKWVINGLQSGTLTQLIFPWEIHKLSKKELHRLNEAVNNSTRLERMTCKCSWDYFREGLEKNYSVIGFVDREINEAWRRKKSGQDWVLEIMERNRKARSNCFEASISTFLIFKQKLNRDMGNLFASWVWETRGTKIWSF